MDMRGIFYYYIIMDLKIGQIVNHRYEITRMLGEGATSTVYLVRDKKDVGMVWALKQLTHSPTEDERDSLFREISFLSSLSHENLVHLEDYFVEDGWDFLVMERVDGPTLEDIIQSSKETIPEIDVVEYAIQICRVLSYLHRQKPPIVYRDLKPANIMITVPGQLKLIDLGIARHFNPMKPQDTTPLGTPGYCPPEQYGRGQTTPRSDIYSLGATFYHALTFEEPTQFQFNFPPVTMLNPYISDTMEQIIMKCLQNDPNDRFPSINTVYDHLIAHKVNLEKIHKTIGFRVGLMLRNSRKRLNKAVTNLLTGKLNEPI